MVHEQLLSFFNMAGAVLSVGVLTAGTLAWMRLAGDAKTSAGYAHRAIPVLTRVYWAGVILFVLSDIGRAALPSAVPHPVLFPLRQLFVGVALLSTAYLMYSLAPRLRPLLGKPATPKSRRLQEHAVVLRVVSLAAWYAALLVGAFL